MAEILFKSYNRIFYIMDNSLYSDNIQYYPHLDLDNIKYLDDVKPLYHYRDRDGEMFPVYYEHNGRFITKGSLYYYYDVYTDYTKDYTLVNLKML